MSLPVAGVHSTSLRLTLLIPASHVPDAVRRLHAEFIPG